MPNKPVHILCTRPVEQAQIVAAANKGIAVEVLPFIETKSLVDAILAAKIQQLAKQPLLAVFTSGNAIDAVIQALDGKRPLWQLFCIGNTTREKAVQYFGENQLSASALNATALAERLIQWPAVHNSPIVFFCGRQRRNELPEKLNAAGIALQEFVVYETLELTHSVSKNYDALLFFSPSAVHSFFKVNQAGGALLFAIGETTAATIKTYSSNTLVIGNTASKKDLLEQAVQYFEHQINK